MGYFFTQFLASFVASAVTMKYNLAWHRKIIVVFIPLFAFFIVAQTTYFLKMIERIQKQNKP